MTQFKADATSLAAVFREWLEAGKQPTFSRGDMIHIIGVFERAAKIDEKVRDAYEEGFTDGSTESSGDVGADRAAAWEISSAKKDLEL